MVSYSVEKGKLFLDVNGEIEEIKTPAIIYDKNANLLLKHGDKDKIQGYYDTLHSEMGEKSQETASEVQKQLFADFLSDCCMRTFDNIPKKLVAEFLNEAISTTGAVDKQLAKLEKQMKTQENEREV